jgi:hypothetical protein
VSLVPEAPARALPTAGQRLRCAACGNVTRFDVVTRRRTAAYWHYTLAGELTVTEERDLEGAIERVSCRWCGSDQVDTVDAPSANADGAVAGGGDGPEDGSGVS